MIFHYDPHVKLSKTETSSCIPSVFNRITKHWLAWFFLLNCDWQSFLLLSFLPLFFLFIFLLVCQSSCGLQVIAWCAFPSVPRSGVWGLGWGYRMVVVIAHGRGDLGDDGCLNWRRGGSGFEGLLTYLKVSQPLFVLHVAQVVWEEELTGPTKRRKKRARLKKSALSSYKQHVLDT